MNIKKTITDIELDDHGNIKALRGECKAKDLQAKKRILIREIQEFEGGIYGRRKH